MHPGMLSFLCFTGTIYKKGDNSVIPNYLRGHQSLGRERGNNYEQLIYQAHLMLYIYTTGWGKLSASHRLLWKFLFCEDGFCTCNVSSIASRDLVPAFSR